jgi:hypothetical protein
MSNLHHANHSLFALLDPMQEELELESQVEQAKEANPELEPEPEQGKPQCITPPSLTYILI